MTAISSVNYTTKRIFLHADTVTGGIDVADMYVELIDLFILNQNDEQSYIPPIAAQGNIPKGGGKFTQLYGVLQAGWRLVPYDGVSHTLRILREIVSEDGISDRNVFDRAPLPPTILVDIDTDYDKVEVREVTVGGNQYTLSEISNTSAQAVWDRQIQLHNTTGTYGAFVKTLMTVAKFIGLQK